MIYQVTRVRLTLIINGFIVRTHFLAQIAGPTADILRKAVILLPVKSILLIDGSAQDRRHYSHILKVVSPNFLIFHASNRADGLKFTDRRSFIA